MTKESTQVGRKTFSYRCIVNKEFEKPDTTDNVTKQFHLELGEGGQAVIVEDRNIDWVEMANKDLDQVGLANVLRLAQKGLVDLSSLAFKDEEALDLSDLDPSDPEAIKATIASKDQNTAKLESIASKLGVSVDELVDSMVKGSLTELISSKLEATEETKAKDGE